MKTPETLMVSILGFSRSTGITVIPSGLILETVESLGIDFYRCMPTNFGDDIIIFNARKVPEILPEWIDRIQKTAQDWVGRGVMTQQIADDIKLESMK